ncbi:tRNA (adenine(22)-N(1))-methyltransferase TrmK [Bacillus sp. FJAT-47783]|uniref:tRNA (adenine(22)-N(1))-methyltransferase n=1 Tax=Bacillus sp. FJAT-47783 TaxID=2922712 RepID=UPI001FAC460D|nr:tRNA (adenine(22)-N(1))-methyltransferase TrmK [Bacillus sp. FJAT-47783]
MNEIQLSKRLRTVAKFIPKGAVVADIGSDHAYLPCYAILNGIAENAIAGEVNEGPYRSALLQVKRVNLTDKISVRKGDGLSVLGESEATCITIAGMGGTLIKTILEEGKEKLRHVSRLILQPNIHAIEIRKWLYVNGWELKHEEILEEDKKIYEVLVADKGDVHKPYEGLSLHTALLMGPFLMKEKSPVYMKKWTNEKAHWENVYHQLNRATETDELKKKKAEMKEILSYIKEGL